MTHMFLFKVSAVLRLMKYSVKSLHTFIAANLRSVVSFLVLTMKTNMLEIFTSRSTGGFESSSHQGEDCNGSFCPQFLRKQTWPPWRWRTDPVFCFAGIWWLCPPASLVRSVIDVTPNSTRRATPERSWNWLEVGEVHWHNRILWSIGY